MQRRLTPAALDVLFYRARSASVFRPDPVDRATLQEVVESMSMAPTGMNALPLRLVFITTEEGRKRLKPALLSGNVSKMESVSAPVTAILARDLRFHEHLPRLFPQLPQTSLDAAKANADSMSLESATLQAAYFILAVRAHGLDAGPMGGFSKDAVDREFFSDGSKRSILLVALGYHDETKVMPRNPRLAFEEMASFA